MHGLSYADELAEVRVEIARLRAREGVLRDLIVKDPAIGGRGRWTRVEVVQSCQRRLLTDLLPAPIRADPAYHREKLVTVLRCLPLHDAPTPRPGWPIQRGWGALH